MIDAPVIAPDCNGSGANIIPTSITIYVDNKSKMVFKVCGDDRDMELTMAWQVSDHRDACCCTVLCVAPCDVCGGVP